MRFEQLKNIRKMEDNGNFSNPWKKNKQCCNNYYRKALLNVAYTIFFNCKLSRLKGKSEQVTGNYQYDFRPEWSTMD